MSIHLFKHNQEAYNSVTAMLEREKMAAVIHPTGTGKSLIAFKLAEEHPSEKFLWLSPSEYIYQTQLENLGMEFDNIQFMSYSRLMKNEDSIETLHPDYIILDEFHRCGAAEWGKSVRKLLTACPDAKRLGLSATNIRYLDNQRNMAEEIFDGKIASEMTLGEAIVRGILPEPKYVIAMYSYKKELDQLKKRIQALSNQGLITENQKLLEQLRRALEQAEGLDIVFEKHMEKKNGKYIVFCSGKEHMDEMKEQVSTWFRRVDCEPRIYTAFYNDTATDREFREFKKDNSAHLKLLFCIDMLNEGVHVAGISGVILFRPTVSPIIYKQQIGRALTAGDSATPLILDVVNNFEGLSSISGLQDEMTAALQRLYANGEGDKVVTDRFEVVEQVHDCRVLFEQLQSSLSSTWDHYYSEASIYYAENGNLDIPRRYKTPMGLSLGAWLQLQRQIRSGTCGGRLTQQQIERLDSIGMRWDNYNDLAWTKGYEEAEQYYAKHRNLMVPANWKTADGYPLGRWISNKRTEKLAGRLDEEKITSLEQVGMVWDAFSEKWERGFAAAAQYYAEHGNLIMPVTYTTKDGLRLGVWLRNQKQTYANGTLQQEKAARLEGIGIRWEQNNYDFQWSEAYAAAKLYFEEYGNLNVPIAYTTADGIALGKWVARQQYAHNNPCKSNCKLTPERVALLDKVGMQWEKPDPWQHRYDLAQDYLQEHGDLLIPAKYKTDDGIWLGRWLYEQKVLLRKQSPKLNAEQIDKLRKLLGVEPAEKAG